MNKTNKSLTTFWIIAGLLSLLHTSATAQIFTNEIDRLKKEVSRFQDAYAFDSLAIVLQEMMGLLRSEARWDEYFNAYRDLAFAQSDGNRQNIALRTIDAGIRELKDLFPEKRR